MTDERLKELIKASLHRSESDEPAADVWPRIASRLDQPPRWSYVDLGLAAAAAIALMVFPEWLWLLAYHL